MANLHDPSHLAQIGELFCKLFHEQIPTKLYDYASSLDNLLKRCELNRTVTAFGPFRKFAHDSYSKAGFTDVLRSQLRSLLEPARAIAYEEIGSISVIVSDQSSVPNVLTSLAQRDRENISETQIGLIQDTILCMKSGAFRPAIVMAWAFGLDMIREWVFRDESRREEFNILLSKRTASDGGRTIQQYHDFYKEKEAFVLDILRDATGSLSCFTAKTHRQLQSLLDDRNAFGHANTFEASQSEAIAYIERLIRVVTSPPFS